MELAERLSALDAQSAVFVRVWEIIENAGIAMLTTCFEGGLRARPLEARPERDAGVIWFIPTFAAARSTSSTIFARRFGRPASIALLLGPLLNLVSRRASFDRSGQKKPRPAAGPGHAWVGNA